MEYNLERIEYDPFGNQAVTHIDVAVEYSAMHGDLEVESVIYNDVEIIDTLTNNELSEIRSACEKHCKAEGEAYLESKAIADFEDRQDV